MHVMFNAGPCPLGFSRFPDSSSIGSRENLTTAFRNYYMYNETGQDGMGLNLTEREHQELALYYTAQEFGNFSEECHNLFFSDPPEFYRKCITLHFYATFLYSFLVDTIFVGILSIAGFLGNLLTLVVLSNEKSSTGTNFLLRCLCLADSIFLTECFLYSSLRSVYPLTGWLKGYYHIFPFIIQYLWPMAMTTQMIVNWLVVMVTTERYFVVCKPFQAPEWCCKKRIKMFTFGMIIFALIYNIPRYFEWEIQLSRMDLLISPCFNYTRYSAQDSWLRKNLPYRIIYRSFLYIIIVVLVPIFLLIFLNFKLILTLKEARRDRLEMQSPVRSNSKSLLSANSCSPPSGTNNQSPRLKCISESQQKSITLIIVVICTVFVICETPGMIHNILASTLLADSMEQWPVFFYTVAISNALMVVKSSSNFIIYCCCGRKFRYILQRLLARWARNCRNFRKCECLKSRRRRRYFNDKAPTLREPVIKLESVRGGPEELPEEGQNLLGNGRKMLGWVEENRFAREDVDCNVDVND